MSETLSLEPKSAADNSGTKPLSLPLKLAYGFGSVAYGIKNGGFDYFLLIFYSQVIGLDARLVGLAITLALIFDAISDPIVGYWSDNVRSRWGRRHPFMYAAALPVACSYFILWNPPADLSQQGLFWFLLINAVLIRTCITVYETPSSALAPDLTQDYDERSRLISFRYFFGWTGGNAMTVLMFLFMFPAFTTAVISDGQFNREAYRVYGLIASGLMFIAMIASAAGTHSRIPMLKKAPPKREMGLTDVFKEVWETLSEPDFVKLFISAIFGAIASGMAAALSFYFLTYFWGFDSLEKGAVLLGTFASAIIGFGLAPIISAKLGKKKGAMIIGGIAFAGSPLPILLRLLGWLPENGHPGIFWFVLISGIIDLGLIICFQILVASMGADLVERSELKTGRRSEGIFTASMTFVRKSVQGFGLMAASMVLTLAGIASGANVDQVSDPQIWRMGAFYVPTILTLWFIMMFVISTYQIDRESHEATLRQLADRKQAAE